MWMGAEIAKALDGEASTDVIAARPATNTHFAPRLLI
jgi:hypothetical protein